MAPVRCGRLLAGVVAVVVGGVSSAGTTAAGRVAGPVTDRTVAALRTDPVYVDPAAADLIPPEGAAQIRSRIGAGRARILIAAEPVDIVAEAGGDPAAVVDWLSRALAEQGIQATLGVVFRNPAGGTSFRAASNVLAPGQPTELAVAAFRANRDLGPAAVVLDFVGRVQAVPEKAPVSGVSGGHRRRHGHGHGARSVLLALLVIAATGAAVVAVLASGRRQTADATTATNRSTSSGRL